MIRLALTALFVIVLSAGCSKQDESTAAHPSTQASEGSSGKVVGFSQIGAESTWRTAETESIKSEAQKRGVDLQLR